jgi:hypothetical protein
MRKLRANKRGKAVRIFISVIESEVLKIRRGGFNAE